MTRNRPDHIRYTHGGRDNENVPWGSIEMGHNSYEDAHSDPIRMGKLRPVRKSKRRDAWQ